MRVILASKSPRRKELLKYIVNDFEVIVSDADEECAESRPDKLVEELSRRKASAVAANISSDEPTVIIGADTVVSVKGKILGKPANYDEAAYMISLLSGDTHQVYTGVTVIRKDENGESAKTFSVKTDVHVKKMTPEEIKNYVSEGGCCDKAGAYAIQGSFCKFITSIEGDYSNVVGLPVSATYDALSLT